MEEKVIKNEIVLFENQDVKLEVNMKDETVWLNANQMSELFGRDSKTIRKHIDNALKEELDNSTVANFATVGISANSSASALLMCLPIVFTSLLNNVAICCLFSHIVSSFKFTSNFTPWFSNKIISFFISSIRTHPLLYKI